MKMVIQLLCSLHIACQKHDLTEDKMFGGGLIVIANNGVAHINTSGHFEYVVGGDDAG